MQHSNVSYPVIGVIYVDGYPVNFRFKGGGTLEEAAVALVRSMLPQNDIAKQEGNHVDSTDSDAGVGRPDILAPGIRSGKAVGR